MGAIGAPDAPDLEGFEGGREEFAVVGVVSGEGDGKVVSQAIIGEFGRATREGAREFGASFEDFEDELFVIAALARGEVSDVLHGGGFDMEETASAVAFFDHAEHVFAQAHIGGEHVAHALDGGLRKAHGFGLCVENEPYSIKDLGRDVIGGF